MLQSSNSKSLSMITVLLASSTILQTIAFTPSPHHHLNHASVFSPNAYTSTITSLEAKKKKGKRSGKGFGKKTPEPTKPTSTDVASPFQSTPTSQRTLTQQSQSQQPNGLSSIEGATNFATPQVEVDPSLPTDQRTKEILKKQYGLRTYEEQQGDIIAAQKIAENSKRMSKIKKMSDEEFDIFMVLPPSLIRGIDSFLKLGLGVTTVTFVLAGFGITAEAWSVATNRDLPEGWDEFIVNTIEPNFTTGLFVLLGFSISLGIFATAQLGSGSSVYKENP